MSDNIIYVFDFTIDVVDVSLVYAVVGLVFVAAGIVQVREMMHGKIRLKGHGEKIFTSYKRYSTSDVVRLTWPFGLASILSFVYVQSDLIMVKYIVGDSEAGFYNVAAVIYMSIMILPTVIYQKFFVSKYHRWASHNKGLLLTAYKKGNAIMLLLGVGVMIACVLSSDYIVVVLFGGQYEKSVYLVNILLVAVPFSFVAYSAGAVLVTKDNMKIKIKKMGVVAVINILLNVMLIPEYHAKGAAVATLISSMILLLLYLYAAQRNIFNGYAR